MLLNQILHAFPDHHQARRKEAGPCAVHLGNPSPAHVPPTPLTLTRTPCFPLDPALPSRPDGQKKAYVRLTSDYDALDVANKIGII